LTVDLLNQQLLQRVCLGNLEAMNFLVVWQEYVHEIDDIVDGDRPDSGDICATFAKAIVVYTHPFWLKHISEFRQLALNITLAYADSAEWERGTVEWKKQWADHNRHVGMELVLAVAMVCGGYDHARGISKEQREICYHEHHKNGEPS
jgi:hypothetical protein